MERNCDERNAEAPPVPNAGANCAKKPHFAGIFMLTRVLRRTAIIHRVRPANRRGTRTH
jgi:hypothetical protein